LISPRFVIAVSRIAEVSGLSHLVDFQVADAAKLPFEDGQFTVVWNQCSLNHDETWLREFNRVLSSGGRMVMTFEIRGDNPDEHSDRWSLPDILNLLQDMEYSVEHAEDITERDIEIGWKALDRKLSEKEEEFTRVFGADWVRKAHEEFAGEINRMRQGR